MADVHVRFIGDTSHLHESVTRLRGSLGGLGTQLSGVASSIGLTQVAAAAAGFGIATFAKDAVENTINVGQAAFGMSKRFGLGAEEATRWISAGQQLGLSADQLSTGFKFLGKNMEALNLGAATAQAHGVGAAFEALGIPIKDSSGHLRNMRDVMLQVADKFAAMPDGAEKAGLAVKLFGRSGTDLIGVLDQGSAGIKELLDNSDRLGTTMSGPQVAAAHKAFLAQKELELAIRGLSIAVGEALLPAFSSLINALTPVVERGRALWSLHSSQLEPAMKVFGIVLGGVTAALVVHWAATMARAAAAGVLHGVMLVVRAATIAWTVAQWALNFALTANPIGLIIVGVAALAAGVIWAYQNVGWFRDAVNSAWGVLQGFGGVVSWVRDRINDLVGAAQAAAGAISRVVNAARDIPVLGGLAHIAGIPGFAEGGIVPGPIGAPMLAMVHGGEAITPAGAGASTYNINVSVAPTANQAEVGRAVVLAIQEYERRSSSAWRR